MDLSYATILVFGGELKILYRDNQLVYIISDGKSYVNHPIYVVDTDFGSCILQVDDAQSTPMRLVKPIAQQCDGEDIYHPCLIMSTIGKFLKMMMSK
jgi:hypothetical protein